MKENEKYILKLMILETDKQTGYIESDLTRFGFSLKMHLK